VAFVVRPIESARQIKWRTTKAVFPVVPHQQINALFVRLISHQLAVLFSQNKSATSNQPAVLFSQNKPAPAISHQPNEQAVRPLESSPPGIKEI
jgi:hypothetical protein